MFKQDVSNMRQEYAALVLVANGLVAMVQTGDGCNVLTLARMAEDARHAARAIASAIERILRGGGILRRVVETMAEAVSSVLNAFVLNFC